MKNWQLVKDKNSFNELTDKLKLYNMEYSGPQPKIYPCVACVRLSTNPKTTIDLAYPYPENLHDYLQMVTQEQRELFRRNK